MTHARHSSLTLGSCPHYFTESFVRHRGAEPGPPCPPGTTHHTPSPPSPLPGLPPPLLRSVALWVLGLPAVLYNTNTVFLPFSIFTRVGLATFPQTPSGTFLCRPVDLFLYSLSKVFWMLVNFADQEVLSPVSLAPCSPSLSLSLSSAFLSSFPSCSSSRRPALGAAARRRLLLRGRLLRPVPYSTE